MENEKELTEEKIKQKSEKLGKVLKDCAKPVLKEFSKIVGRDLTDEENEKLVESLNAYFMMSTLLVHAFV